MPVIINIMATDEILYVTLAGPGVEVVTQADGGKIVTTVNGGRLDGEQFTGAGDAAEQHERACRLARLAARPLRRPVRAVA
jgi:hypothetical protein